MLLIVAAILTVIAAAISVFIFASAAKPTVNRQLSELRLVGAGGRELASFILLRMLILCLIASILGTAAGYGCLSLFSELVLRHFLGFCTIHFSFLGCGLICAVIFILTLLIGLSAVPKMASQRPLETSCPANTDGAERTSNNTDSRPSAITYSIFGKWMRTVRKKRRAAEFGLVAAMSIAYLSVFAGTAFGITIRDEYSKSFSDDYSVHRFGEGYYTLFKIPEYPYYGISAETLNTLAKTGEAEYISYIKRLNAVIVAEKGQSRLTDFLGQDIEAQSEYSSTNYSDMLAKLGLDAECAYYNITVIESDDRLFSMLETEIGKSPISSDGVGAVIICGDKTLCPYSIGDRIKLFQSLSGAFGDVLGDDCKKFDTTVTVTGITEIPITSYLRGKLGGGKPTLVVTEGFFEKLGYSLGASDLYIGLADSKNHEKTDAVLASVMPSLPESRITSAAESESQKNALLNTVSYSAAIVAVFLTAICISVFVSATRSDLLSRRKSIGILRSIGIDKKKLLGEQTAYTLRIFGKAALINLLTVFLLNLLPIRRDMKGFRAEIPIAYIVSAVCALAATLPTVREFFNEKISDMTRWE